MGEDGTECVSSIQGSLLLKPLLHRSHSEPPYSQHRASRAGQMCLHACAARHARVLTSCTLGPCHIQNHQQHSNCAFSDPPSRCWAALVYTASSLNPFPIPWQHLRIRLCTPRLPALCIRHLHSSRPPIRSAPSLHTLLPFRPASCTRPSCHLAPHPACPVHVFVQQPA